MRPRERRSGRILTEQTESDTRLAHIHAQVRSSACNDARMFRAVTLGFAISVLVAACALVEQPVPAGTYPMEAEVRSAPRPVDFSVVHAVGGALPGTNVIAGAVQPASIPAGPSNTKVTFYLPSDGQWLINIPSWGEIEGKDFGSFLAQQCAPLVITFNADGSWGWGC